MKKIFIYIILTLFFTASVTAKGFKADFTSVISDSDIPKSSVSMSVKNVDNGKVLYQHNEKILSHPASVQKLLTLPAAVETLGEDYRFSTELYKSGDNGYLIKLGADPYLNSDNLNSLVSNIKAADVKQIYIDDSIIERKDWGEGWQWDDSMNVSMPKFNSYNLDGNLINITVMPTVKGQSPLIINSSKYPIVFLNNVITGDKNDVKLSRDSAISGNALMLSGTVSSSTVISFPIKNLQRYFDFKLTQSLENNNIYLKNPYKRVKVASSDVKYTQISHPISFAIDDILKNSNNMAIETVMKIAGGKKYETIGTDSLGLKLFEAYCNKLNLNIEDIRLVDASGVSKNNLVNADFVTNYLVKQKDNETLKHLPCPGEGTLSARMIPLKDNLRAKTGTLSDISSIAGYITSKKGKQYAFCIIINDPKSTNSDKKALEDYLIRTIYIKG